MRRVRRLSPFDELLAHQIPEPITTAGIEHPYWRESYFFEAHDPDPVGDMVALGFANYPQRQTMDAVLLGRVGDEMLFDHVERPWGEDPHTTVVGQVEVIIEVPFERARVKIDELHGFTADLTYTARTKPYVMRRGRSVDDNGLLIWDQSQMIQSGTWSGEYRFHDTSCTVDGWTGQRDHSWGVRDHGRVPMWSWFAIQLPDGMLGAWHWEETNGAPIFTDGCWAPADGGEPVPVIGVDASLHWLGTAGGPAEWSGHGEDIAALGGRVAFRLADGRDIEVTGRGTWGVRYAPFHGGGQMLMAITADDGREGTAIFEITGHHHHHYFPTPVEPT